MCPDIFCITVVERAFYICCPENQCPRDVNNILCNPPDCESKQTFIWQKIFSLWWTSCGWRKNNNFTHSHLPEKYKYPNTPVLATVSLITTSQAVRTLNLTAVCLELLFTRCRMNEKDKEKVLCGVLVIAFLLTEHYVVCRYGWSLLPKLQGEQKAAAPWFLPKFSERWKLGNLFIRSDLQKWEQTSTRFDVPCLIS